LCVETVQHARDFPANPFARTGDQDPLLPEVELKIVWEFHGWQPTSSAFRLNANTHPDK
jgi:hypothetical protein